MKWSATLCIGFLTGMVGLFGAGCVAAAYVEWYRISPREGGAGYFVIGLALLGGLAGWIIGMVTSRLVKTPGFWRALAWSSGLVLGTAAAAALAGYLLADLPPTIEGNELRLR